MPHALPIRMTHTPDALLRTLARIARLQSDRAGELELASDPREVEILRCTLHELTLQRTVVETMIDELELGSVR
jgi:hypothetical protein